MSAASADNEQGSDLDEPMGSQSKVSKDAVSEIVIKPLHFMPSQISTVSLVQS